MKKFYFLAVAAIALMASCTKTELVQTENDLNPIAFENFIHKTTKATSVVTTDLQTNGFKVSAYYTPTSGTASWYFKNFEVSYADSKYSTTYYWPETGTMDFYAVYPKTFTISDSKTFDYSNTAAKTDIVTATDTEGTGNCATHTATASTVALTFNHILTQIYFSGKTTDENYYCKVSKIEVVANGSVATYTFGSGFSTPTTAATYPYLNASSGSEFVVPKTTGATSGTAILIGTGTPTVTENSLMVTPNGDGSAAIATVKVYYKSYDAATDIELHDFTKVNGENGATADTFKTFTIKQWTAGKSVNYAMTLPVGANPIEFTATVSDWATETTVNVGDGSTGSLTWN